MIYIKQYQQFIKRIKSSWKKVANNFINFCSERSLYYDIFIYLYCILMSIYNFFCLRYC